MKRIDVRTPDAWRAYDVWSGMIALAIPLILLGVWAGGITPPLSSCCGVGGLSGRAPVVALPGQRVAPDVEITSQGERVTLRGRVADAATRAGLVAAAQKAFGGGNVVDALSVDGSRGPLTWLAAAPDMLADFRDMPRPAAISSYGSVVTLAGTVDSAGDKEFRAKRARTFFGDKVTISNGIMVRGATAIAAPKIDCASLTRGAQVVFATSSAELDDQARAVLEGVSPCLSDGNWEVGGHTDNRGSDDINDDLSLQRATAVVSYLTQKRGASNIALTPVGYGSGDPISDNSNEEGRSQNRRISFKRL
jgi:OmpA-OmpF porin, OOP family